LSRPGRRTLLLVAFGDKLANSGSEPNTSHISDKQYRTLADCRLNGRQEIVDSEISVCLESNARESGVVGGGRGRRSTEKRSVNALPGIGPDAIARREEQAASRHSYMAIETHLRIEGCDSPRCAGRNAAHDVEVDCSIRGNTGDRDDSDGTFEFQSSIVLSEGHTTDSQNYERYQ